MITSDERSEIAQELRELRHATYYHEEVVENIIDVIRIADPVNTFCEPEDIYKLLADLIEPTCCVVSTISYDWLDGTEYSHELSCGHTCNTICPEPPEFCDKCGARVAEKDVNEQHRFPKR